MLVIALQALFNGFFFLANAALTTLPTSPFIAITQALSGHSYHNLLTWLIPFDIILVTLTAWVSAILIFYVVKVPLRWVRIIK
jgi:hypothetical protein